MCPTGSVSDDAGDRDVAHAVLCRELAERGATGSRCSDDGLMLGRQLPGAQGGVSPGISRQVPNDERVGRQEKVPYGTDASDPRHFRRCTIPWLS